MKERLKLGFLASGTGSNVRAIIRACEKNQIFATPTLIISNNEAAPVLSLAKQEGIPSYHRNRTTNPTDLDEALLSLFQKYEIDLLVLAGYLKPVGKTVLGHFNHRIINIHPALLPNYGGKGMYGRHIHEAVIAAGERETGVTVHMVDQVYDNGKILAQRSVPVFPEDTPEVLAQRVLAVEHAFFPEVIGKIASGEIVLE